MNRRVRILAFAVRRLTTGGGVMPLLRNVAAPRARTIALRHIESLGAPTDEMHAVRISGHPDPLYHPADGNLKMLYQVVAEQMQPWMWHHYETPETQVRPGDVILDCGAAEGLFAFLVRSRAAHVYAFEPSPEYARCLARTFPDGGNVTPVAAALSDRPGTAYLSDAGLRSRLGDAPVGEAVRVTTIDEFCAASGVVPTYLKADLEGSELSMLRGGAATIRAHKPRIAITTYHLPGDVDNLRSYLATLRPDYRFRAKGIEHHRGEPVMLHAW